MQALPSCALIVTHQNVSDGPVVTPEDTGRVLVSGAVALVSDATGPAVVSYLVQEDAPHLILCARREVRAGMSARFSLYHECVSLGSARIAVWEALVQQAGAC